MSVSVLMTVWLSAVAAAPWAQGGPSQAEDLVVSVVTFGPGSDLPSWWGHTALVVEDERLHHGRLYNYGMFDFSTGFVHKFVQGRLEFWVGEAPVLGTYELYRELDRDVRIQILNLTPAQRLQVARALANNVRPENRDYLYHHYNDNCSTRPRDMIDLAFDGQLKKATAVPARMSLREHTRRYSAVMPPMSLILDYLQNDELDRPITQQQEAFLPDELERQLDQLTVVGPDGQPVPAVAKKVVFFRAQHREAPPETPPNWLPRLALLGVALGAAGVYLRRRALAGATWARRTFGLLTALVGLGYGSLGVFLFIVGIWTNHQVAHRNENLFLVNPVTFAALPLGLAYAFGRRSWAESGLKVVWGLLAITGVLSVVVKLLPAFDQNNWNLIALIAPMSLGWAVAFWPKPTAPRQ